MTAAVSGVSMIVVFLCLILCSIHSGFVAIVAHDRISFFLKVENILPYPLPPHATLSIHLFRKRLGGLPVLAILSNIVRNVESRYLFNIVFICT